jgi:YVTN family beta-propeller protein
MVYVSDFDSNVVYIINGNSYRIEAVLGGPESPSINVNEPSNIDVNPQTNMVYVAGSDSISVINGTTNEVVRNIPMDSEVTLTDIDVNPLSNMIYITGYLNFDSTSTFVSVINGTTNKVVDYNSIIHIGSSEEIALNPKTNLIYVVSSSSESVSVINGTTNEILMNP